MKFPSSAIVVLAVALLVAPVYAHHSDAMFEREKILEITGTIEEFQFTNPHTWIQLNVLDDKGSTVEWSLEWGSPNQLGRQGVRPATFPAGEKVTIRTNPMRDGTPGGAFIGAKFSDGKTIGRWE